jgi:hypothetical protein
LRASWAIPASAIDWPFPRVVVPVAVVVAGEKRFRIIGEAAERFRAFSCMEAFLFLRYAVSFTFRRAA